MYLLYVLLKIQIQLGVKIEDFELLQSCAKTRRKCPNTTKFVTEFPRVKSIFYSRFGTLNHNSLF